VAGLSITDDPRDIRDILPDALTDCGTAIPDSDSAAAQLAFTHLARLHTDRQAAERWILDKVSEIITRSGYADSVLVGLPLGGLYGLDDEWAAGWGRTEQELKARIREACAAQLSSNRM
jgi:hypothetical protein